MFSIGEFSKITGMSIKALRLYHERGLLIPKKVDQSSGYRYYDATNVYRARAILYLKQLLLSLDDIQHILEEYKDDADVVEFLLHHQQQLQQQMSNLRNATKTLQAIIKHEQEAKTMAQQNTFEVEEKQVETILVASIRYKGRYAECGKYISKIYKAFGRYACGKPLNLYYDEGYKENDADIETCIPVRKGSSKDNISVKELSGGKVISLIHKGPYDQIGRSYEKLFSYRQENGISVTIPSREIYIKGPGWLFKGNPNNYLTELQMFVK